MYRQLLSVNHESNIIPLPNTFENKFFSNCCASALNRFPNFVVKSKCVAAFKHNLRTIYFTSLSNYVSVYDVLLCFFFVKYWFDIGVTLVV